MDLSFQAIHDVVHPTAAFSQDTEGGDGRPERDGATDIDHSSWSESQLNPKNRIDSLELLEYPLWRIDGSTGLGTQYFAVPLFLPQPSPMRLDVFIHEGASYPPALRQLLDLDQAFHTKDAERVRRLGVARYILRILQLHTQAGSDLSPEAVHELYRRGPFGSQLVIENLSCNIHESTIQVHANHVLEGDLLSYKELKAMWESDTKQNQIPPLVQIQDVCLVRQLFDSICLVRVVDRGPDGKRQEETELLVMKSVTSEVRYLYRELHALLFELPDHENLIARPQHLVTKQSLFGTRNVIIGFTIPYHPNGTLRDILPVLRIHGSLELKDQFRWARQTAAALLSVWDNGHRIFYPDLRLDNILLSKAGDIVLVDFEQRGVWCDFSAREVDFFEYVRILARDNPDDDFAIPDEARAHYQQILADCDPHWDWQWLERIMSETRYSTKGMAGTSYNIAWLCLTRREREAAMVYMLGRVLWCIFEGVSAPHAGAVWQSYRWEPDIEFPSFRRTPLKLRPLLRSCCWQGQTPPQEPSQFVRRSSKLYMKKEVDGIGGHVLSAENLRAEAKMHWQRKLAETEEWIKERRRLREASMDGEDFGRPSLTDVIRQITHLEKELLPQGSLNSK